MIEMGRVVGRTAEKLREGNCERDILYGKSPFLIKEK